MAALPTEDVRFPPWGWRKGRGTVPVLSVPGGTWLGGLAWASYQLWLLHGLKDYIGIKLPTDEFHKCNGVKYAAWFGWKKTIRWVRAINTNLVQICCGGLMKRSTVVPYVPCNYNPKFTSGFLTHLWKYVSQICFFLSLPGPSLMFTPRATDSHVLSQCPQAIPSLAPMKVAGRNFHIDASGDSSNI